jgi:hypothetical protein
MSHAKREVGAGCAVRLFFDAEAVTIAYVIALVGIAPCQCFSLGGNQTTSPGRISSINILAKVGLFMEGALHVWHSACDTSTILFYRCLPRRSLGVGGRPSQTGYDDQRLTEWMRMPGSARTRLERDAGATNACRVRRLE